MFLYVRIRFSAHAIWLQINAALYSQFIFWFLITIFQSFEHAVCTVYVARHDVMQYLLDLVLPRFVVVVSPGRASRRAFGVGGRGG